jgi:hypothetical protein
LPASSRPRTRSVIVADGAIALTQSIIGTINGARRSAAWSGAAGG